MKERKIQSKWRYLAAFLIGTAIFIFGFFLTYSISYLESQRISNMQNQLSYEIFKDKLSYSLFGKDICSIESLSQISKDLRFQGKIIEDLEKKFGKEHEIVLFRKKFYTLIELEHFEFINKVNENCNSTTQTILFFYSNEPKDIDKSEMVGDLLSVIYRRNHDLIVYSFDINLESNLITRLLEKYNIEESPTVIINNSKIINPKNAEQIEKYLS